MNKLENDLRKLIIKKYGNLSEFSRKSNIPYTTIDSMLKRGIKNANVINVIKMCDALQISVDSLKKDIITPVKEQIMVTPEEFMSEVKALLNKTENLSDQEKQHLISNLEFICTDKE